MENKVGISIQNKSAKCKDLPATIFEKDVCVKVDGGAASYEVIRVYSRNAVTGIPTLLHYETKQGILITGAIEEVCCNCDTLCDYATVIVPIPNQKCIGYSGQLDPNMSNSGWMINSRYDASNWTGTCGTTPTSFTWELMSCIVNGVELVTSPIAVTIPFASMTLTAAGIATNYATAFNALPIIAGNDIILDPDMVNYSWNTSKPFLLGFRQYTSDNICTPNTPIRIDFIKGGAGDGWDLTSGSSMIDFQTKAMSIYNDPSVIYPMQSTSSCTAI